MRSLSRLFSREAIVFWLATLLICGIVGTAGYVAGRDWIGKYLAQRQSNQSSPELQARELASGQTVSMAPIVVIREREPTEAELRELGLETPETSEAQQPPVEEGQIEPSEEAASEAEEGPAEVGAAEAEGSGAEGEAVAAEEAGEEAGPPSAQWIATAGSYRDRRNAEQVAESLAQQGIDVDIEVVEVQGKKFNRVRASGFATREQAEEISRRIQAAGYPSQVMRER